MNNLLAHRRAAHRRGRFGTLAFTERAKHIDRKALRLVSHSHHGRAGGADGVGIGGIQEEHGGSVTRVEFLLAHLAKQVSHVHRHIAEIDVDRAGCFAFVAHRAVMAPMSDT